MYVCAVCVTYDPYPGGRRRCSWGVQMSIGPPSGTGGMGSPFGPPPQWQPQGLPQWAQPPGPPPPKSSRFPLPKVVLGALTAVAVGLVSGVVWGAVTPNDTVDVSLE